MDAPGCSINSLVGRFRPAGLVSGLELGIYFLAYRRPIRRLYGWGRDSFGISAGDARPLEDTLERTLTGRIGQTLVPSALSRYRASFPRVSQPKCLKSLGF